MYTSGSPFWDKTWRLIREIWPLGNPDELKDLVNPDLPDTDLDRFRQAIDGCLAGRGGEVSARSRAAELGRAYLVLDSEGRRRFLEVLATEYGVDNVAVEKAIDTRSKITTPNDLQEANERLRNLLEAPRTKLLRHFNELPDGVRFLVDMRADLLPLAKKDPALKGLDRDLYRLLVSWFDVGFLDLRRITWETPAAILEKLIKYEAVHAISSWKDLKNRLRDDRRCYGFFHPKMVDEPLIFVEVALVEGLADNVQRLLDLDSPVNDPEKADTAIFYSISNCQKGLAGVSFGNFLIKRVVADLAAKHHNLKTFSTLSPIPGFMYWLSEKAGSLQLEDKDKEYILQLVSGESPADYLRSHMEDDHSRKAGGDDRLSQLLMGLCAGYLLEEKKGVQALDRVAHFHLSNGAQVERINWGGNVTDGGLRQSASMMVNYLYKLSQIEKNHELYSGQGIIAASSAVRKLARS